MATKADVMRVVEVMWGRFQRHNAPQIESPRFLFRAGTRTLHVWKIGKIEKARTIAGEPYSVKNQTITFDTTYFTRSDDLGDKTCGAVAFMLRAFCEYVAKEAMRKETIVLDTKNEFADDPAFIHPRFQRCLKERAKRKSTFWNPPKGVPQPNYDAPREEHEEDFDIDWNDMPAAPAPKVKPIREEVQVEYRTLFGKEIRIVKKVQINDGTKVKTTTEGWRPTWMALVREVCGKCSPVVDDAPIVKRDVGMLLTDPKTLHVAKAAPPPKHDDDLFGLNDMHIEGDEPDTYSAVIKPITRNIAPGCRITGKRKISTVC